MITLKTLAQATDQEVFDQVAQHMLAQGKRSINKVTCAYRGDDGLTCAAGCLIGEDEYSKDMELKSWGQLVTKGVVPSAHFMLISALQRIHDMDDPKRWRKYLGELADQYNLSWRVLL